MSSLSRRGFLKVGASSLLGAAVPWGWVTDGKPAAAQGRVLGNVIRAYDKPSFDAKWLSTHYFDKIIPLYEKVKGTKQPDHNPIWYRIDEGFVHSSWVQWVPFRENQVVSEFPEGGFLGEITVPLVDARRQPSAEAKTRYRLYATSVYRVHALEFDQAGLPWYKLLDDRLGIHYYVPAETVRQVLESELTSISPDVAAKRIEVDLTLQRVTAYENDEKVFSTLISAGLAVTSGNSSERKYRTPTGKFRVERKKPSRHMGYGELSAESDYELPGVPWVSYFHWSGVAFHGAYWHNDFGRPRSQGCVNMRAADARWIYRWTLPALQTSEDLVEDKGTDVRVFR